MSVATRSMIRTGFASTPCALAARLPSMLQFSGAIEGGGLISYGPNFPGPVPTRRRLVDKILRGAKPADIPVEQPTKFDLVINLTTAGRSASNPDAARPRRRGDRMSAPGKAGAIQPVEVRPK